MVNPNSRLAEFDRQLPGFAPGGPVDKKNIKLPEQKPILSREEKVRVDWKAVGQWLKDFHNQKHPFQKGTGKIHQPTKLDRVMYTILDPRKKATIIKNIALNVGQKVAPDLIDKVQSYFSTDNISALDKYIEQQKQTISPHGYKGIYEQGEKSLRELVNKINTEFIEPVDPSKNIFTGTNLENILENNRSVISKNNLIDDPEIAKNFGDYMSQRRHRSATVKTEKEYDDVMENFLNKIEPIKNQQNDPLLLRDLLTESWKETTGKDVITSSAQAKKLDKTMTKNQWRRFYNKFIERNPQYKDIPFSKFEFDTQQVNSKINELIEQGTIPPHYATETKQAALFFGALKEGYSDLLPVKGRLREGTMARYLDFIRRTRTDLIDPINDPSYKKFFSIYNPNELNIPGSKFYKDYQKFTKLDNKRAELSKLLQPILKKLSPKDSKFSIQLAHKFESSKIGDAVSKAKLGKGGDPGEMYLDLSSTNISKQTKLEERARNLQKLYEDTENPEHLIEIAAIDTIMRDLGVEGQVVSPIVDRLGNVVAEPGFTLGQAETNIIRKIINIAEANKIKLGKKDMAILREAYGIFNKRAKGGMVQSMRDGGIIRYFQDGTGEEGVTADQGSISGFDVKPFIPPGARIDEDPLTLGDIGRGASEVAETAWPYMVPGVGEALSHRDYRQFSSEAEQAWEKGEYPAWLGATILGSVALGGTIPNWTVVGAVPNIALGIYKGAKKALTSPKKIAQKPVVEMEKRFIVKDNQNKSVEWKQTKEEADEVASKLSAAEGTEFKVIETQVPINMPAKIKKKKPEKTTIEVTPEMTIGSGDNRIYYSKLDEILTNPTGNMRVKTGDSGNVIDIPINDVSLTAKEWHNTLRMAGIKESELTDSYIRQYLNKIGKWDQTANDGRGAFTSNAKISYQEIKGLADESPSRFLQTSSYSTKDGNLKYGSTGRSSGYKTDSAEEHVLWIDSNNIKGDTGKISEEIRQKTSSHRNMKEVETDVNFAAKNKLEGEPYIIGWSLVDERPGKIGNSNVSVSTASEIQSDFLQMLQKKKNALKKDLQNTLQAGNTSTAEAIKKQLDTLVRPLGLSDLEVNKIITALTKNQEIFSKAAKLNLDDMSPAVFKELDLAAKERDVILTQLNQNIDQMTLQQAFPNVPFKNQKEWVDAIIKNDLAIAAKKLFYFDENGVLKVNKDAPTHYAVSPSNVVKNRWMSGAMEENPNIGMSVPPNMRTSRDHGKAVAYDMQYGGPNIKDHNGNLFRGNAEESLRKIAANKNATFSVGKVNFGGKFEDTYLIEITPEMLTPYIQYFKHGGLVETIPYNPLRSVLDVLGPIGAY